MENEHKLSQEELELKRQIEINLAKMGGKPFTAEDEIRYKQIRAKKKRQYEAEDKTIAFFKAIFFPPLVIAFKLIKVVSKGIGCLSALGLPYGLWCGYKVIRQLMDGVQLGAAEGTNYILLFVALPFAAFAVSVVSEKLEEYFEYNR